MKELSYKSGQVSNAPNSFDIITRTIKAEPKIITEVVPEVKEEMILAEPVLEEYEEAPILVEEKVVKKATKKTTKKETIEDNTEVI